MSESASRTNPLEICAKKLPLLKEKHLTKVIILNLHKEIK